MDVVPTDLPGVLLLKPRLFEDERGFFMESWSRQAFADTTGLDTEFVQDNHSQSTRNVLRGLHYQVVRPQGKLVRVVHGSVFDVAVDIRCSSPSFGQWFGVELSADNKRQLWIPPGFAHGFLALSESADLLYKTTDSYYAAGDRSIRWDDPQIAVGWPIDGLSPTISPKDRYAPLLRDADLFE